MKKSNFQKKTSNKFLFKYGKLIEEIHKETKKLKPSGRSGTKHPGSKKGYKQSCNKFKGELNHENSDS